MDLLQHTADLSVDRNGWNVFGAFIGRNIDINGVGDADDFGGLIRGGFFLSDNSSPPRVGMPSSPMTTSAPATTIRH